jgi:predicted secreted protein
MNAPSNIPLSEQWSLAAHAHVEAEAAAQILEETKSAVLAQMMSRLGDMPVSKAEMQAKSSDEWRRHVEAIVRARQNANKLRVERDYLRMRFQEWIAADANHRTAARL